MPTIKAKFESVCRICGKPIHKGETVKWWRGWGVKHPSCDDRLSKEDTPGTVQYADTHVPPLPMHEDDQGLGVER
jgi:hypothetical protein